MGQLKLMRKEKQEMPQETKNVQRTLESNETLENVVEKGDKLENYNIRQIHNYTPVVSSINEYLFTATLAVHISEM